MSSKPSNFLKSKNLCVGYYSWDTVSDKKSSFDIKKKKNTKVWKLPPRCWIETEREKADFHVHREVSGARARACGARHCAGLWALAQTAWHPCSGRSTTNNGGCSVPGKWVTHWHLVGILHSLDLSITLLKLGHLPPCRKKVSSKVTWTFHYD